MSEKRARLLGAYSKTGWGAQGGIEKIKWKKAREGENVVIETIECYGPVKGGRRYRRYGICIDREGMQGREKG